VLDSVAFDAEVGRRSRLPPGHAVEAAEVVLETLAACLPEELVLRIRKQVHPSLAQRMTPRADGEELPVHVRHHPPFSMRRGPTLSTGRPGFSEPLAEAHGVGAQRGSVLSPNPHGETKISSARGTTQEQDGRTLAETTTKDR